ncbi:MAG: 1,4-dihydroxy-6-naphthoate synthase [Bacteroidetes bacterium]|nr:1,4-dihydroxy-6-naphthoate synthase [Bacteroidota bacterium]
MKLTLGFSPCPNDTFIFDALVNKKIETDGLEFDIALEDVQTLNEWALRGKLEISKISYGVLPRVLPRYHLLDSGGALGKGVGPLLIAKKNIPLTEVKDLLIAIPGEHTSAHVLFSLAFPSATNKKFMIFSEIENAVLTGKVDAGVIIHENRFTYMQKGLVKLIDLGEYWEAETGYPIPLGGIVIRKDIDASLQKKIGQLIRQSVEFAFSNYPYLPPFVKEHSQEMEEHVMRQHIDLYVNNYSISLGQDGMQAIKKFIDIYEKINPVYAAAGEISLVN